jgi:5-methyltetrahydrofolate--homocysteine methyltransferase
VRRGLEIPLDQGRRYSWGYPACPDQSEHEKVWRLLGLEKIGMTLSGGFAVMPEQSTVAIIAHHPQAVYFGMKSGFIPAEKTSDELIAGTERGGDLPPETDPDDDAGEAEDPAKAESAAEAVS